MIHDKDRSVKRHKKFIITDSNLIFQHTILWLTMILISIQTDPFDR